MCFNNAVHLIPGREVAKARPSFTNNRGTVFYKTIYDENFVDFVIDLRLYYL